MQSKALLFLLAVLFLSCTLQAQEPLAGLSSPILFKGDERTAYRDPAVLFHNNRFYLFYTYVTIESDSIFQYTALSESGNLTDWTPPRILTPRDQRLNYSSPGNIIRFRDEWILCLQTYPRPDYTVDQMPRFGTGDARIFIMRSKDLVNWSEPELLPVKGNIPEKEMGRMIDPYLIEDKDHPGKWWCFYKQNGVSMFYTTNFKDWTFHGYTESGENVCVLNENGEYILFHSPKNGIAMKKSKNLSDWEDYGELITLGQEEWEWAKGRITAGTVINLKDRPDIRKYVMFFHGSGPLTEEEGDFDKNSSIGIAWSEDLLQWEWPGQP
ncbi:MAG: hypothetical protein LIP05_14470 [Tannerellaceae bacterium]|nr:hypothetical protein [Tannerellaceae bacterium]